MAPGGDSLHRTLADIESRLADPKRLHAVAATLERPVPPMVDVIIRAVAADLDATFAAVTVLDDAYQHFLSTNMGAMPSCEVKTGGCQYVIGTGSVVALNSTTDSGWVGRLMAKWKIPANSSAYLGVPLKNLDDEVLGAVCVIDERPRVWTAPEHYAVHEASVLIAKILAGETA